MIYSDGGFRGSDGGLKSPVDPFSVKDGILTISAVPLSPSARKHLWNQEYSSGLLTTKTGFRQQYGYFEMRAKLPSGAGFFPAFWLLPSDESWPPEIDIVEQLSRQPDRVHLTQHTEQDGKHDQTGFVANVDSAGGFHTYGVLWDRTWLVWYIDGVEAARTPTPRDMNRPMFIIVNLAVGGEWGGPADGRGSGQMLIDYVRAYSR
jgi:beta-glucanase (GH16 family)